MASPQGQGGGWHSLVRLRTGELLALAGAVCVIVSLLEPWYQGPVAKLDAWATFGPAVALLLIATAGALGLVFGTVAQRGVAVPVAAAVWTVLFGLLAVIAAVVRLLERPDHASDVCAGAWLALVGAAAIFAGAWQSLRDERPSRYEPLATDPRPGP